MNVANRLTDKLIESQIIESENRELYSYGFWQGAVLIYNFATVVAIGLIFNMVWHSIIFMMAYGVIRPFAGGYHAKTQVQCYLFSVGMMVAVLWLIKLIPWTGFICFVVTAVSSGIICVLAPVGVKNKPLDQIEKVVYKKRTHILLCLLIGLIVLFWIIGQPEISICITLALSMLSFMLVLGNLIKN